MSLFTTPLGRFRLVAFLEGLSYVVLVFICMPLKYWANMPEPVRITGSVHGALFVLYVALLAHVFFAERWSIVKTVLAFIASLIPFGTFVLEWRLELEAAAKKDAAVEQGGAAKKGDVAG